MKETLYGSVTELKQIEAMIESEENLSDDVFIRQEQITDFILKKTDSVAFYNQELEDNIELIEKHLDALKKAKEVALNKQKRFHKQDG